MPAGRRYALRGIGIVAVLFCVGVILGQTAELDRNALMLLLLITPLYALIGRHAAVPWAAASPPDRGS